MVHVHVQRGSAWSCPSLLVALVRRGYSPIGFVKPRVGGFRKGRDNMTADWA